MSHMKEPWGYGIVREGEQVGVERTLAVAKQWVEAEYVPLVPMKQRDDLLAALEKFMDAHEECTDFDGFTAQIVSMDDYHEAQEAIASVKGTACNT